MGKVDNIRQRAVDNTNFRQVLDTGRHTQLVIMHINPGEDIGEEVHKDNDQILYLVAGQGVVRLEGQEMPFNEGDVVLVQAGTKHNFIANSDQPMKIITTYSPPHHPNGTVHPTKADAA